MIGHEDRAEKIPVRDAQRVLGGQDGTRGILGVVGVAPDLATLARSWERIFSARLRADTQSVTIDGPGSAIRFLVPRAFRRCYGPVGATVPATGKPGIWWHPVSLQPTRPLFPMPKPARACAGMGSAPTAAVAA